VENAAAVMQQSGPMPSSTFWFRNNIAHANVSRWPALFVGPTEGDEVIPGWAIAIIAERNDWSVPAAQPYAVMNLASSYTASQIKDGAFGTGNISVDPRFVGENATPPDVHLQGSSPCINAGQNVGQPFAGSAPDMGRYEY
jgi:hypothetical protein